MASYTFLLSKNQPRYLPEVMSGDYTQRWGKWPMMDAEAVPLISPKINGLSFGEKSSPLWL